MTEHVVTRWYRPPELMLCPDGLYTHAVDMWSVGCIFAELLGRRPLFPGKNFVHQLTLIFDVIGSPKHHEVAHIKSRQAKKFLASVESKKSVDLSTLYPDCNPVAVDLLKKLLVFEPSHRLTSQQVLAHPYFDALKNGQHTDPPVSDLFEFDFESQNLSRGRLKALICEEVKGVQRTGGRIGTTLSTSTSTSSSAANNRSKTVDRTAVNNFSSNVASNATNRSKKMPPPVPKKKTEKALDPEAPTPKRNNERKQEDENVSPNKQQPQPPVPERRQKTTTATTSATASATASATTSATSSSDNDSRRLRSAQEGRSTSKVQQERPHGGRPTRTKSAGSNIIGGGGLYGGPVGREKGRSSRSHIRGAYRGSSARDIGRDVAAASDALKAGYAHANAQGAKKSRVTVPKSPQFSKMSWQKKYSDVEENARARKDRIRNRSANGGFSKIM